MTGGAIGADLADDSQSQIFCPNTFGQTAAHVDLHRLRLLLRQALGGENVFYFGSSDAEGQGSERAMGAGVAIAADDCHPRLSQSEFRSDHMDNSLLLGVHVEKSHAEFLAI